MEENESLETISGKFNEFHAMVETNIHKTPRISQIIDEFYKSIILKKLENKSQTLQYKSILWLILEYLMNKKGVNFPNEAEFVELTKNIVEFLENGLP